MRQEGRSAGNESYASRVRVQVSFRLPGACAPALRHCRDWTRTRRRCCVERRPGRDPTLASVHTVNRRRVLLHLVSVTLAVAASVSSPARADDDAKESAIDWRWRRAQAWARANGGASAARAMREYQHAATVLAFQAHRVRRQHDLDALRDEPALLAALEHARARLRAALTV